jgi:hypothetical protein
MKSGFVFPGNDPVAALECAVAAETAGWDGFFVWEAPWSADAWAMLGAIAARTERIRIGTLLTPIPIRRPWKLAGETATIDVLSDGRLILAVGLGAPDTGFASFGLPTDRRTRAELLDEGLEILTGLWSGQPFSFSGRHYEIGGPTLVSAPTPVQRRDGVPHIPVWIVGAWGRPKSMARVLRCDGMLPHAGLPDGSILSAGDLPLGEMRTWLDDNVPPGRVIDLIVEGTTPGEDPAGQAAILGPLADAGATWWIESLWDGELEAVRARIDLGPPRI